MNFAIGFGETEKRAEEKLELVIREHVLVQYARRDDLYFTDDFIKQIEIWVDDMAAKSQTAALEYKTAEKYPDRYSSFWVSTVHSPNHIVFILTLHHINRRHPMSPDGWAMMKTKRLIHVDVHEADDEKRKAA